MADDSTAESACVPLLLSSARCIAGARYGPLLLSSVAGLVSVRRDPQLRNRNLQHSGRSACGNGNNCVSLGFDDFACTPITRQNILATIGKYLGFEPIIAPVD